MRKVLAVARKELRQAVRDPISLGMLIGLPAMMLLLYGYALNFDVRDFPLGVEDRDRTRASRALVEAFAQTETFRIAARLAPSDDPGRLLDRGTVRAVLVIPENFARDLEAEGHARVQMLLDGTDSNTASNVLGQAVLIAAQEGADLVTANRPDAAARARIEPRPRIWFNPELKSTQFLVPGLIGFILMLTAVISTALSVVREKERGTMEQLMATPLRPQQLLIGKTVPYLGISLTATVVILVAARLLFDVRVTGPYLDLFAVTLLYLIGALGYGLFISTFARTQAMAFQAGAVTAMLPAIFLSGFIFPLRSMPLPLQVVSYAVPARYYLIALRGIILKGSGLGLYPDQALFLAIFAAVVLGLAWIRLTRSEVVG